MDGADSRYGELAAVGPYAVEIGGALITMVEPHPGREIAYNRWYEDDHYYAGALAMPWTFAGRRWVAPNAYRAVRFPLESSVARPVSLGRYISTYWITKGRLADNILWGVETNKRLRAEGRGFEGRTHVFTAFQDFLGVTYHHADGPRDIHALDYPYQAPVAEVVDGVDNGGDLDALDKWLAEEYVPAVQASNLIGQTLRFRPLSLPIFNDFRENSENARRITLLHFLEADPLPAWSDAFVPNQARVAEGRLGALVFCAPFIPTLVGTNTFAVED